METRAGAGSSSTTRWRETTTVDIRSDPQVTPYTNSGGNDYAGDHGSASRYKTAVVFALVAETGRRYPVTGNR
jgi:hypothetical protein